MRASFPNIFIKTFEVLASFALAAMFLVCQMSMPSETACYANAEAPEICRNDGSACEIPFDIERAYAIEQAHAAYQDLNLREQTEETVKNDKDESKIMSTGASFLKKLLTNVLLPVALALAAWRTLYIAIVGYIMGGVPIPDNPDPLGYITKKNSNGYGRSASGGGEWNEAVKTAFKTELKKTVFGWFIIMALWGIINLVMTIAIFGVDAITNISLILSTG